MGYKTILFERGEGYAAITLNRPERLNAFTAEMHGELKAALDEVEGDATLRALVLSGAGRGFCAGQDLGERRSKPGEAPRDLGETIDRLYNPLIRRLRKLDRPVLAAVNGVAAGAGANLALACDIVLAARSASFIQPFCRLGLVPDAGGSYFLPRLVGEARAMALALLGESVSAERAVEMGMIWKCVDDDKLMEETLALARHLATQPTKGLALIKQAIRASYGNDLARQLDLERDFQRIAGRSEDYREGVAAFLEKRTPRFKGR
ncbi:MAG: 2-(1,2-epoxy-1,2-dihydrophenyl)acetyl-CoA isomerase PaaG [Alphaproteobacteria bacterium]